MTTTIETKELARVAATVRTAACSKGTLPILGNVIASADGGTFRAAATD
jgi:DNA polymerase III sliding clamp (beta) subunit (PCNA family)